MPALILDAHQKSALAAVRSVGSMKIPVIAGAERRTAMGLHSKYTRRKFVYPSPLKNKKEFVEAVLNVVRAADEPPVLYTFSDSTLLPLYEAWHRFEGRLLAVLPSPAACSIAFDKAATLRLAERLGIPIPRTLFVEDGDQIDDVSFPAVVKPRRSANWRGQSGSQNSVAFAFSAEELWREVDRIKARTGEMPLVQELLYGEELGAEFLCRQGEVIASCAHRRIRSLSPAGGAAVVKETICGDYRGIGEAARAMLRALQWSGPAMVEFKIDDRDGRARLLEINGRFWGSLPLAVHAGADFPAAYYHLAHGQPFRTGCCQPGQASRHWLGDLANLLAVWFRRDPMRPLLYPSRSEALRNFFSNGRSVASDVAAPGDRAPALFELLDSVYHRLL